MFVRCDEDVSKKNVGLEGRVDKFEVSGKVICKTKVLIVYN